MSRKAKVECINRLHNLEKAEKELEDALLEINFETESTIGHGIEVKPSKIINAGNGLFATRIFKEDDVISGYPGKRINHHQMMQLTQQGKFHYIASLGNRQYMDGSNQPTTIGYAGGCFANNNSERPNAKLYNHKSNLYLVALRTIQCDDEITIDYKWPQACWDELKQGSTELPKSILSPLSPLIINNVQRDTHCVLPTPSSSSSSSRSIKPLGTYLPNHVFQRKLIYSITIPSPNSSSSPDSSTPPFPPDYLPPNVVIQHNSTWWISIDHCNWTAHANQRIPTTNEYLEIRANSKQIGLYMIHQLT